MLKLQSIEPSDNINDSSTIVDINRYFRLVELSESTLAKTFIQEIDGGEYIDGSRFKDRFGVILDTEELSTGCKAAIVLANNPNKQVSLLECGTSAILSIIKHINDGSAIIYDRVSKFDVVDPSKIKIDISLDNYRFTILDRLNYYLTDEQGYDVDLSKEGIQCLE